LSRIEERPAAECVYIYAALPLSSAVSPGFTVQVSFKNCGGYASYAGVASLEEFQWVAGEASLTALGSGKPP
jgi:hypothetical protein